MGDTQTHAPLKSTKWTTADGIELCAEQIKAAEYIHNCTARCIVLTGYAGSGKSVAIRGLVRRYPLSYRLAATTGRAAMLINGVTVDRLFCFSRENWKVWSWSYLDKIMEQCPRRIVIDEASMVGLKMANLLADLSDQYNKQLILVGDWAQCCPVKDEWPLQSPLFVGAHVLRLTENHRQHDAAYMRALNVLRNGEADAETEALFRTRVRGQLSDDEDEEYVRMYATNAAVDAYNMRRLQILLQLTNDVPARLSISVKDLRRKDVVERERENEPEKMAYRYRAMAEQSGLANNELIGLEARVMLTRNSSADELGHLAYVNGDTGYVEDILYRPLDQRVVDSADQNPDPDELVSWACLSLSERQRYDEEHGNPVYVRIRLDRTGGTIMSSCLHSGVCNARGEVEYIVSGFPLRLGWACTIHKSQGASVPKAWVDMESIAMFPRGSRHGLAYVALSRTYTLDGLLLSSWNPDAVECDEDVKTII